MGPLLRAAHRARLSQASRAAFTSQGRRRYTNNGFLRVSDEVQEALRTNKPVVALETTIYTHGTQ